MIVWIEWHESIFIFYGIVENTFRMEPGISRIFQSDFGKVLSYSFDFLSIVIWHIV